MAEIFISYSNADKTFIQSLAERLETKGWSVWWDNEIPIGKRYDDVIESELQKARCVLVIWTAKSVASEWVKNEASDAAQRRVLLPVLLENIKVPLAFRRIETAMLTGWNGKSEHPELDNLFDAITAMLNRNTDDGIPISNDDKIIYDDWDNKNKYRRIRAVVFICLAAIGGVAAVAWFWPTEKIVAIRVVDWKDHPITDGDVRIDLQTYTRSQSIDKTGQALFTGVPAALLKNNLRFVVSSPGYTTKSFDTLVQSGTPMELMLPLTTVIIIKGRVKTAAENPIKGVEINVDGTKYYATSISDGSYNLRVEEYTMGDEITITTSHPGFDDKTFSLRINSPQITNQDIVLNPVSH